MIRLATLDDAGAVAEIYRPYVESTVISFEVEAPTPDEMRSRISSTLKRFPWLIAEVGGRAVGYAYASPHHVRAAYQWSVDTAVYVGQACHRTGVGRHLYGTLLPMLVRQGFVNAYAGITLPNEKSVGLHEVLGFVPVGVYRNVGYKLGQWHDVGWWSLALQPLQTSPPLPVALQDIES